MLQGQQQPQQQQQTNQLLNIANVRYPISIFDIESINN